MQDNVENTERRIGIEFSNKNILKEALTHRSFLNENPSWQVSHNERLEYLGDAVAELIVTEFLYSLYPDKQEGELTSFRAALVNYQMMALVAREVMLEQSLFLSKGEMKDTGRARDVILANAFEALVGAIYLDRGYDVTRDFLSKFLLPKLDGVLKDKLYKDPKSLLQEIIQEKVQSLERTRPGPQESVYGGGVFR